MCGRYILRRIDAHRFGIEYPEPRFEEFSELRLFPRFNIAPSQPVAAIRLDRNGSRVLSGLRWGLIPHWARTKPKSQPINARAETVGTSGMFRDAFERRRCLIPADGFYEWKKIDGKKQPYLIHLANDAAFAFAGVWERWKPDETVDPIDTCAIITTAANALMAPIHERMPAIIDEAHYDRWLDRDIPGSDVKELLRSHEIQGLEAHAVSTSVNRPQNEGPDCVARIAEI
jgi:putative SOS response-associated peptidase YedK